MASSRITYPDGFKLITAVTVGLILFFLTFLPKTGGESRIEERKTVLGSKPPGCINKCLSCRPCKATLVVPSHQKRSFKVLSNDHDHDHDHDHDGYYLLSWKCRCGNKLFQP